MTVALCARKRNQQGEQTVGRLTGSASIMKTKEILDRIADGTMSRRRFATLLASAGVVMATMPLAGRSARAAGKLTYFTWTGYDDPGFFPQYVEKHGGPPDTPIFADEQEALTKLRAGFVVDVAHPCSGRINTWRAAGVVKPIDTSRLSNWSDVFDSLKTINDAHADGQQWFVPVDWGNTSVLYRTDLVDIQEESWTLLWDKRYAGKLSIGEDITDTAVIVGLLVGAKDPYDMTDEEIAKVKEKLLEQKPLLRFYWSDNTAMEQALQSGEIVASSAWNSSAATLVDQGVPVKYANPKEGILSYCCGLMLIKGGENEADAYDLLDAMIDPAAGKWLIEKQGYGHSNKKAFALVDDAVLKKRGLPKDPTTLLTSGVFSRENKRVQALQQMFESVKAAI
jgi:spermidine/putrescine transport system substrate-binding protein